MPTPDEVVDYLRHTEPRFQAMGRISRLLSNGEPLTALQALRGYGAVYEEIPKHELELWALRALIALDPSLLEPPKRPK